MSADFPPDLTQSVLSSLTRLTEAVVTMDRRIGAYRAAEALRHASKIHPKNASVVFAGNHNFADNAKYAFLSFLPFAREEGFTCAFLPYTPEQESQLKKAGLPCLPHIRADFSPEDRAFCLSAKALVMDNHFVAPNWRNHLPHSLLAGAKTIQLWHGIPIKEIGLEVLPNADFEDPSACEIASACGPFDVFAGPSEASTNDWRSKFAFAHFAPIGFPRNDVFFRAPSKDDLVNVDLKLLEQAQHAAQSRKPFVLYAPTFRDYEGSAWLKKAEIDALADACATRGYLFAVNLHPAEQDSVAAYRQAFPNVSFVEPFTDAYPLVRHASVLITDYSSLAFDYLLLDRPVVFYRPDHGAYVAHSRRLISDHADYLCGPEVMTLPDLVRVLGSCVDAFLAPEKDAFKRARRTLRERLFDACDGMAGQRLNRVIADILKAAS